MRRLSVAPWLLAALAVLAFAAPAAAQGASRPTVALIDFDYASLNSWWGNQDIGKGVADLVVDGLVEDGSYRMIERKRLDAILAEQNFSNSDRADPSAAKTAQIGKALGVKYLIVGSITKFGMESKNTNISGGGWGYGGFGVGDVGTKKGKATVAVTARMLDTTTGERQGRGHVEPQRPDAGRRGAARRGQHLVRVVGVPRHGARRSHRGGRQAGHHEAHRREDTTAVAQTDGGGSRPRSSRLRPPGFGGTGRPSGFGGQAAASCRLPAIFCTLSTVPPCSTRYKD
jgi:hypothetical protein